MTSRSRAATGLFATVVFLAGCGGPAEESAPAGIERATLVHHTVESDGHPMAVWEKRAGRSGPVILLLHGRTWSTLPDFDLHVEGGSAGTAENLSLMDGFIAAGFATYGMDMRGYGETPRDESGWNTPDRAAADLANVLAWVRSENPDVPVHLFGWSLGSMVSQLTAQRHPELVDRLVLFGYPTLPGAERSVEEPDGDAPARPTTAEAAASDFVVEGAISERAVAAYVEAALAADPVRTDWTRGHQWNALDPSEVTVPTLVIHGASDPLAREDAQELLFRGLGTTDKAWVVVAGGDHAAFLESPRSYFLSVVAGFLTTDGR